MIDPDTRVVPTDTRFLCRLCGRLARVIGFVAAGGKVVFPVICMTCDRPTLDVPKGEG